MTEFYMRLAGLSVSAEVNYPSTKRFCADYIVDDFDGKADIAVRIEEGDIRREAEAAKERGDTFSAAMLETIALHRKVSVEMATYRAVLFHGSAVALDGEVYLFAAPSGTGKSTHARLWREYFGERVTMVNDDKPFLRAESDGKVTVYGSPWDGKHHLNTNIGLPLKAVCVLEQSDTNTIKRLTKKEALYPLYLQIFWPNTCEAVAEGIMETLECILKAPIWKLSCDMSREAVRLAYETMSGGYEKSDAS